MGWDILKKIPGADKLPGLGKDQAEQAWDGGKFKFEMDRLESNLAKIPADKMGIKEDKPSEVVKFIQNAMKNLGQGNVTADGKVTPDFLTELNGYIMAKQGEKDLLGDYKGLKPVSSAAEISGAHLQAIIDSLRDGEKLSNKPEHKKGMEALAKALYEIDDPKMKEVATKIAPQLAPAAPKKEDTWGLAPEPTAVAAAPASVKLGKPV